MQIILVYFVSRVLVKDYKISQFVAFTIYYSHRWSTTLKVVVFDFGYTTASSNRKQAPMDYRKSSHDEEDYKGAKSDFCQEQITVQCLREGSLHVSS